MSSILAEVVARLGLAWDPTSSGVLEPSRLIGVIDGQKVTCSATDRATRIDAILEPALDLGLSVSTRNITFIPTLGRKITLGDSSWDEELHATADEPERAAVLFSGALRGALLGLNATNMGVTMTDERVTIMAPLYDLRATLDALPKAARVAAMVSEARRQVPVAAQLKPYSNTLRALGRERWIEIADTPLSAAGTLREVALAVRGVRTGRAAFDLEVRATPLEGPAAMGLLVRRESMVDRVHAFFGGQDLRTGDAAFDPTFLVRAQDIDRAIVALDADVRALLLDLSSRFDEVTLSDSELSARGPAARLRPEDMEMVLEAASAIMARVVRASGAVIRGPYR